VSDTDTSTALAAGAAQATAERAAADVEQLSQDTESTLEQQERRIEWAEEVQRMIGDSVSEIRTMLEVQAGQIDEVMTRLDLLESEYQTDEPVDEPGEEADDVTILEGSGGSESPEDQKPADEENEPAAPKPVKHKKRSLGLW